MEFLTNNAATLLLVGIIAGLYVTDKFSSKRRRALCASNRKESNKTLYVCNSQWAGLIDEITAGQIEREAAHAAELRERDAIIADLRMQLDRARRIMDAPIREAK